MPEAGEVHEGDHKHVQIADCFESDTSTRYALNYHFYHSLLAFSSAEHTYPVRLFNVVSTLSKIKSCSSNTDNGRRIGTTIRWPTSLLLTPTLTWRWNQLEIFSYRYRYAHGTLAINIRDDPLLVKYGSNGICVTDTLHRSASIHCC